MSKIYLKTRNSAPRMQNKIFYVGALFLTKFFKKIFLGVVLIFSLKIGKQDFYF